MQPADGVCKQQEYRHNLSVNAGTWHTREIATQNMKWPTWPKQSAAQVGQPTDWRCPPGAPEEVEHTAKRQHSPIFQVF